MAEPVLQCTRRNLLRIAASSPLVGQVFSERPAEIGNRKQLFIDRRFIASSKGITLVIHPASKAGPMPFGDRPWEKGMLSVACVLEHEGAFRMWYSSRGAKGGDGAGCLATSADGIRWERPNLGLVEFEGSRENNILPKGAGVVSLDPVAPPHQRFKMLSASGANRPSYLGTNNSGALMLVTSPDGLQWNDEFSVLPFHPDTSNQILWDPRIEKFVAYLRGWNPNRVVVRAEITRDQVLKTWPYTPSKKPNYLWRALPRGGDLWPAAISTELQTVMASDDRDPLPCDIYTPCVHQYPWADNVYLAFPSLFRHTAPPGSEKIPMKGVLNTVLAVSRDGINWDRLDRRPYLRLGFAGEPDSRGMYMATGLVRCDCEIHQYYTGVDADHGDAPTGNSTIMRAAQRLDGFVAATAGSEEGEIVTPLLTFQGSQLQLNIDTSASGSGGVEILDAGGLPVPGFEMRNCGPIIANDVAHQVAWRNGPDAGGLQGKPVRLRFRLRNSQLFAFQFV